MLILKFTKTNRLYITTKLNVLYITNLLYLLGVLLKTTTKLNDNKKKKPTLIMGNKLKAVKHSVFHKDIVKVTPNPAPPPNTQPGHNNRDNPRSSEYQ